MYRTLRRDTQGDMTALKFQGDPEDSDASMVVVTSRLTKLSRNRW
jgi:hypothetical protein